MRLRSATVADAPALTRIWYDAWHSVRQNATEDDSIEVWERTLRKRVLPGETVVLAHSGGKALGFMAIRHDSMSEGFLHLLYVAPKAQRAGVGSRLLNEVKRQLPSGFRLYTLASNLGAVRFYTHHGIQIGRSLRNKKTGEIYLDCRWVPGETRSSFEPE